MVQPFALALAVGSYSLFLFLSIYSASCPPCLHPVQLATATFSLFDVHDPFALTAAHFTFTPRRQHVALWLLTTMLTVANQRRRRQWDPGIPKHIYATSCPSYRQHIQSSMATASWIDCSIDRSSDVVGFDDVDNTTMPRLWDSATLSLFDVYDHFALTAATVRHLSITSTTTIEMPLAPVGFQVHQRPASCFLLPLTPSALATVKSLACLFHYSHPVLSRPTVPNI